MKHTNLWVAAAILAGIILAGFVLSVPHTRDIPPAASTRTLAPSAPSVALRDSFKKGLHTITGSVEAPNPCTSVSAKATTVGTASSTTGILIELSMPEDTGMCLKRSSMVFFSTTITAPARLPITATVNGVAATTTGL